MGEDGAGPGRAGWVRKLCGRTLLRSGWKERYIRIERGRLLIYQQQDDAQCEETVDLGKYQRCQEMRGFMKKRTQFRLTLVRRPGMKVPEPKFQVNDAQEKDLWVSALNEAIRGANNKEFDQVTVDEKNSLDHLTRNRPKINHSRRPPTRHHRKDVATAASGGMQRLELGGQTLIVEDSTSEEQSKGKVSSHTNKNRPILMPKIKPSNVRGIDGSELSVSQDKEPPGEEGEESPVKEGEESPVKEGEESPVKEGEESPVKEGEESPVKDGEEQPGEEGEESPVKEGEESLVKEGEEQPGEEGDESLVKEGEESLVKEGEEQPGEEGDESLVKEGEESLVKEGEESLIKEGEESLIKEADESLVKEGDRSCTTETVSDNLENQGESDLQTKASLNTNEIEKQPSEMNSISSLNGANLSKVKCASLGDILSESKRKAIWKQSDAYYANLKNKNVEKMEDEIALELKLTQELLQQVTEASDPGNEAAGEQHLQSNITQGSWSTRSAVQLLNEAVAKWTEADNVLQELKDLEELCKKSKALTSEERERRKNLLTAYRRSVP